MQPGTEARGVNSCTVQYGLCIFATGKSHFSPDISLLDLA